MTYGDYRPSSSAASSSYPPERERDGCMTAFLLVIGGLQAFAIVLLCLGMTQLGEIDGGGGLGFILILGLITAGAGLVCTMGLWNWQAWGYSGLLILYGISIVLNLLSAEFGQAVISALVMGILYLLYRDKTHLLD
jgi:hypothetical protein